MSVKTGAGIPTDGLVFYYDSKNKKSWKGPPTTNVLPSPSDNGRFTTNNSWGTYNTNQYNGNTYFSITSISSVSDNIITTSGNHPLRSYDVVTPQTSGGGVTAGTNYLVKKINNNQFTLHSWNSSQDGSQGYKVSNYHKVHESLALDQRISVNSSSFPTMWWGPPHVANSGLVKEIVNGVGPEGQSVMRLHIHRSDGVADGMAYGVYVPVTAGDIINVSYWARTNYPGKGLGYSTYFGPYSSYGSGTTLTDEWQRVKFQWTASGSYSFYQYWWPDGSSSPYYIDICDLQVELNTVNGGSTPFVAGTRSNTQAVLDLTNNHVITASNMNYYNSGSDIDTFSWAANIDARLQSASSSMFAFGTGDFTLECWIKPGNFNSYTHMIALPDQNTFALKANVSDGGIYFYSSGFTTWPTSGWTLTAGVWNHVVLTRASNVAYCYLNGVLIGSKSGFNNNFTSQTLNIGNGYSGEYTGKYIDIVKIYNRALSAGEVKASFGALRSRYGL